MANQTYNVIDPMGQDEYEVELPVNLPIKDLINELITALKLQPGAYSIQNERLGRILGPSDTLSGSGSKAGDLLRMVPHIQAA